MFFLQHHPDAAATSADAEHFVEVQRAYEVLNKTSSRQQYDAMFNAGGQRYYEQQQSRSQEPAYNPYAQYRCAKEFFEFTSCFFRWSPPPEFLSFDEWYARYSHITGPIRNALHTRVNKALFVLLSLTFLGRI